MYSWGEGEFGQLGHKDVVQLQFPELIKSIDALKIVYISAGVHHSACITESGTLYTWGRYVNTLECVDVGIMALTLMRRNETHQLGLESKFGSIDTPQLVKGHPTAITLKNVTHVSCGQTHTACIAGTCNNAQYYLSRYLSLIL